MATTSDGHLRHIETIAKEDAAGLLKAHESYGDSWKKRGGVGAYMVMIRKIDRMERQVKRYGFDIVKAVEADPRVEGLIDDIRDARRYLMLIESWLRELGLVNAGDHRDNVPYSDLGVKDHHPETQLLQALNEPKCMAHIPHAKCGCARCAAMREIITPHIEDCECFNCAAVKESIKQTVDQLRTDRKRKEPVTTVCFNEIDHPGGCDCVTCKGVRDTELLRHNVAEAKKRLYEDNLHPVACTCKTCTISRANRARARGCGPQCDCNDCLADHYLQQGHENDR